jgi:hypothetical protein
MNHAISFAIMTGIQVVPLFADRPDIGPRSADDDERSGDDSRSDLHADYSHLGRL